MNATEIKQTRGDYCPECCGVRLFIDGTRNTEDGRRVRTRRCSVCSHAADYEREQAPGLVCPECGDVRCPVVYTRHRKGSTYRVRKCSHCRHRFRTKEGVESRVA